MQNMGMTMTSMPLIMMMGDDGGGVDENEWKVLWCWIVKRKQLNQVIGDVIVIVIVINIIIIIINNMRISKEKGEWEREGERVQ